jgi:hypothetical protein
LELGRLAYEVVEPLVDNVPGDDVPPGQKIVRTPIPIFQIVGMLPDVAAEEPGLAVHQHTVLVGMASAIAPFGESPAFGPRISQKN